jgi:tetratricopeptide (TPR) repeat protein
MALVRKELIRPDQSGLPGDDAFRFRHLLIRDAAYAALPKRERSELHERFATWLESTSSRHGGQYDEVLGYHLEQAYLQRVDLGRGDEGTVELSHRAAHYLSSAGVRALSRSDIHAAAGLLERAWPLASPAERPLMAARLADALVQLGRLSRAEDVVAEGAAESTDPSGEAMVQLKLVRADLRLATSPEAWRAEALEEIEALVPELEAVQDHRSLARALNLLAMTYWVRGEVSRADQATQRALEHARAAGDDRQASHAVSQLAFYSLIGMAPVPEGISRCESLLEGAGEDRRLRSSLLHTMGGLKALAGRFDEARALFAESEATLIDLGLVLEAAQGRVVPALVELYAGDPVAAEAEARRGYEVLEAMGERPYMSSAAAVLALALYLQGLHHEASRFARVSEENTSAIDLISNIQWRTARARVLATDGQLEEAEALARSAAERAQGSEMLSLRGDTLLEMADILRRRERWEEALHAARGALEAYERKQASGPMRQARGVLDEIEDERHERR